MEKISWTDCVKNEKVLHTVKEERNIVRVIKRRKANWIGHILHRNCLLKCVIEEKIEERTEATGRRGRRRKQLLDDLKENKGSGKWKEEALDHTLWNTHFGRGYGPVIRQDRLQASLIIRDLTLRVFAITRFREKKAVRKLYSNFAVTVYGGGVTVWRTHQLVTSYQYQCEREC